MKTALNLIISSNDVDSFEVEAKYLILRGIYSEDDRIIVATANTTVKAVSGDQIANIYSTLNVSGDYVWCEYDDTVLNPPANDPFAIKIFRNDVLVDGNYEERHEITMSGNVNLVDLDTKSDKEQGFPDWESRFSILGGNNSVCAFVGP